jgi:phosphoribosylglycinamide formyltransferase-1
MTWNLKCVIVISIGGSVMNVLLCMDEGKVILQTGCPLDPSQHEEILRARLFRQQCKSLLQVVRWLAEGRIHVKAGRVVVARARFDDFEFSPQLDYDGAKELVTRPLE